MRVYLCVSVSVCQCVGDDHGSDHFIINGFFFI